MRSSPLPGSPSFSSPCSAVERRVRATALAVVALCAAPALASGYEPDYGPNPQLPEPESSLFPTVKVAPAVGWAKGAQPVAAAGLKVHAFARDLDHPRWLCVLPNGDVLVAETNSPKLRPKEDEGLRGWAAKHIMKKAGAGTDSADRITLLRDTDGDGVADQRSTFVENLYSPFGMALVGDRLFIADSDAVVSVGYVKDALKAQGEPKKLVDLPAGEFNHHWTKSLIASRDGSKPNQKLYVGVGSNSNVGENGMDVEEGRAAIWEINPQTGSHRIFASGIRNPIGLAWEPTTGALWVTVNERDEIGNLLVPDYITSVKDGAFYGWPYSYYGAHVDARVKPQRPDLVAKAIAPDYAIGAHTASLGLAAARGNSLPSRFAEGMFVGQHGSWNRKPPVGYKVVFVPFKDGKPAGPPEDVLTGFLNADGDAQGRPVGVALDSKGSLLVADDVGNTVWRVTPAK